MFSGKKICPVKSKIHYIVRPDNPSTPANEGVSDVADFTDLSPRAHNLTPLRYGRDTQRDDTLLYVHSGRSFVRGANYKF